MARSARSFEDDFSPQGAHVEIVSDREATVEGCKGIMEYSRGVIKLNIGKGSVSFSGEGLYAFSYCGDTVILKGKIRSVEYCM